jgi:hypothetical protein
MHSAVLHAGLAVVEPYPATRVGNPSSEPRGNGGLPRDSYGS